jgi:hypothetical protein
MGSVENNYGLKYSLVTFGGVVNIPILKQSVRQDYFQMYYNIIKPIVKGAASCCEEQYRSLYIDSN